MRHDPWMLTGMFTQADKHDACDHEIKSRQTIIYGVSRRARWRDNSIPVCRHVTFTPFSSCYSGEFFRLTLSMFHFHALSRATVAARVGQHGHGVAFSSGRRNYPKHAGERFDIFTWFYRMNPVQ
ncbi:hypothetical protein [Novacetimonas maltaceti]|uniref:hypothetical protein n=1 Tax=Novacetimonas maltaceti TaxID=1203393 RepID=UPI00142E0F8C|nr:hypothetical protein [Novacetimonas maltaceti]